MVEVLEKIRYHTHHCDVTLFVSMIGQTGVGEASPEESDRGLGSTPYLVDM